MGRSNICRSERLYKIIFKRKSGCFKSYTWFTSEIIEILKKDTDDNMIVIGIRGDCVYAIYSVPFREDILDIAHRGFLH